MVQKININRSEENSNGSDTGNHNAISNFMHERST